MKELLNTIKLIENEINVLRGLPFSATRVKKINALQGRLVNLKQYFMLRY